MHNRLHELLAVLLFVNVKEITKGKYLKHNAKPFSDKSLYMPTNSYRFRMIEQYTTWPGSDKNSVAMPALYSISLVLIGILEMEFIGRTKSVPLFRL